MCLCIHAVCGLLVLRLLFIAGFDRFDLISAPFWGLGGGRGQRPGGTKERDAARSRAGCICARTCVHLSVACCGTKCEVMRTELFFVVVVYFRCRGGARVRSWFDK